MDYIKLNGYILLFSGHNEIVETKPSYSLFQNDCVSANHCNLSFCFKKTCLTQSCISSSDCISSSENGWCVCLQNDFFLPCGSCSSYTEYTEDCLQTEKHSPVWIIAAIFSITLTVLILSLCFVLKNGGLITLAHQTQKSTLYCRTNKTSWHS